MNKKSLEELKNIFDQMSNPDRLIILYKEKTEPEHAIALSAKNLNDTVEWYRANSSKLERLLKKKGYNWVYHFETFDNGADPVINLWIGKDINPEKIKEYLINDGYDIPDSEYIVSGNFINLEQEYVPVDALTDELMRKAYAVMRLTKH